MRRTYIVFRWGAGCRDSQTAANGPQGRLSGVPRGREGPGMNANLRNFALWVIIVLLLLALFTLFQNPGQRTSASDISFSQLLNEVDQKLREGNIRRGGALA